MTLAELIKRLEAAGIESAEHDARELFRAFAGLDCSGYIPKSAASEATELVSAAKRREAREPLQYIIGSVGFYREVYEVSPSVLIPRSDTEHLVDFAVRNIPSGERFADLCTGSGCIAISTLKSTVGTTAVALDISEAALEVARRNSIANGVDERLTLVRADVLSDDYVAEGLFAVLSNPPYVSEAEYAALEPEIFCEPSCAFLGGEDGGDFYRALVPKAKKMIKPEGFIALEIGCDQRELLTALAAECDMSVEIIKDYSGLDRVAVLRHPTGGAGLK